MLTERAAETIIRICPMRDGPCPHGMKCKYVGESYSGYPCKEGWRITPAGRAALEEKQGC